MGHRALLNDVSLKIKTGNWKLETWERYSIYLIHPFSPSFEFPVSSIRKQAVKIILRADFLLPSISNCKVFDLVEYISNLYPLGAIILALVTSETAPQHVRVKNHITKTEVRCTDNLMWQHIQAFKGILKISYNRAA